MQRGRAHWTGLNLALISGFTESFLELFFLLPSTTPLYQFALLSIMTMYNSYLPTLFSVRDGTPSITVDCFFGRPCLSGTKWRGCGRLRWRKGSVRFVQPPSKPHKV